MTKTDKKPTYCKACYGTCIIFVPLGGDQVVTQPCPRCNGTGKR